MVLSSAIWDEDPSQFVKDFYLSVCDLYEDDGQRSHYQFAHFLRGKGREHVVLCVCVCVRACVHVYTYMYVPYTANNYSTCQQPVHVYDRKRLCDLCKVRDSLRHIHELGELLHLCHT